MQRKQAEETAYRHTATTRIANTDDVRPLLPGYKEADPLTRDAEYHKLASTINHLTIDRLLADEPNGKRVIILAGGAGSGKTTASGIGSGAIPMDFAIDTVMGWENAMEDLHSRVTNSGRKIGFIYIYTPFEKAFPRVIERFLDKGSDPRLVPLSAVVDGHIGAQQNVLNASGNFSIRIIDNSGPQGNQRIIEKAQLQKYDYLRESGREEKRTRPGHGSDRSNDDQQHQPPSGGKGTEGARERARARLLAEGREILKRYQREGKLTQREVDAFLQEGEFAPPAGNPPPPQSGDRATSSGIVSKTRTGVRRNNPRDWRVVRDLWDQLGYGEILSSENRERIAAGRIPLVDDTWVEVHPEDAGLKDEGISMHHVKGLPLTGPLPKTRHQDSHIPGGFRYNPGNVGSQLPIYPAHPRPPKS